MTKIILNEISIVLQLYYIYNIFVIQLFQRDFMSALTVRLPNKVIDEINNRAKKLHITRSEYIRKSIENMNAMLKQQERRDRFAKISKMVREESMSINSEFSKIEHEPED